jgi:hypothetical protein
VEVRVEADLVGLEMVVVVKVVVVRVVVGKGEGREMVEKEMAVETEMGEGAVVACKQQAIAEHMTTSGNSIRAIARACKGMAALFSRKC